MADDNISPLRAFPDPAGYHNGMTLHDWFAGQALSGLLADGFDHEKAAIISFSIADDMMLRRD